MSLIAPLLLASANALQYLSCNTSYRASSASDSVFAIQNCIFSGLSISSGNGGAVYLSNSTFNLTIQHSMFSYCSANQVNSSLGGAVYFSGDSVSISQVCGNMNSCYQSQFMFLITTNGPETAKSISWSYCPAYSTTCYYDSITFYNGVVNISDANASYNSEYDYTSGSLIKYTQSAYIEYYSIFSCYSGIAIVCTSINNANIVLDSSNIVNNSQGTSNQGMMSSEMGDVFTIKNSVFYANTGGCLFSSKNDTGVNSFAIYNCYIATSGQIYDTNATFVGCYTKTGTTHAFATDIMRLSKVSCILFQTPNSTSLFTTEVIGEHPTSGIITLTFYLLCI